MPEHKINKRSAADLLARKEPKKPTSLFDDVSDTFGRVQINETGGVNENKFLLFFRHFGVPLDRTASQLVGHCPVCGKGKFFANHATGQWDCKVCPPTPDGKPVSGNVYTFIRWMHQHFFDLTTEEDYADLAKQRKFTISMGVLKEFGLALNRITNEWMIPAYSLQKTMANLYSYRKFKDPESGKPFKQIVSAPDPMQQVLFNISNMSPDVNRPLWICEGHWDCMAFVTLLDRTQQRNKHDVVAVCGSAGFPKQYVNTLNGRVVNVVTDNDDAGRGHATKITNLLATTGTTPSDYKIIEWRRGLPDKYDVSDACAGLEIPAT